MREAAARAARHNARLTVLGIWTPSRLRFFLAIAGVNPLVYRAQIEHEASQWLGAVVGELDSDVAVQFACREGRPKNLIADELRHSEYDEVVLSERLASQVPAAREGNPLTARLAVVRPPGRTSPARSQVSRTPTFGLAE